MLARIKPYLPDTYVLLILATVVLASLLPASGPAVRPFDLATTALITLLFFLHGAKLSREAILQGLGHWRLHLLVLASTFVLFPVLGLIARALAVTTAAARALGFARQDEVAIVFCGSKKSLASGVPMAGVLFPAAAVGPMIVPLMLFHPIQRMACAVLARRYAARADAEEAATAGVDL